MEKEIKKVLVFGFWSTQNRTSRRVRLLRLTSTESFERRRYQLSIGNLNIATIQTSEGIAR